jgi:SAM-dependent methyltransferase
MGISLLHAELIVRESLFRPLPETVYLLGRQTVLFDKETALRLIKRYDLQPKTNETGIDTITVGAKQAQDRSYITDEGFFRLLGVKNIRAIDHSEYEGADIIVDLNKPLPEKLANSAEFIFCGSVLDNIFDPATYIKNINRLLKPGGRLIDQNICSFHYHPYILVTPAWYFDYFCLNSFKDIKIYLCDVGAVTQIYGLEIEMTDKIICDFGSASLANPLGLIAIIEKGNQSSWEEIPSQDQYRDCSEWEKYHKNLLMIKKSDRSFNNFSAPSDEQMVKSPLRFIKSFRYLGCWSPLMRNDFQIETELCIPSGKQGIRIVEATYGENIFGKKQIETAIFPLCRGNVTDRLGSFINGSKEARLKISCEMLGDPAPHQAKDLRVMFFYNEDPERKTFEIYLEAEADNKILEIPIFENSKK